MAMGAAENLVYQAVHHLMDMVGSSWRKSWDDGTMWHGEANLNAKRVSL
jgi:hypothetical protein